MDNHKNTIGLVELLDEVGRDLDEFRKKHPSDYSMKNVTLWWEMERERVLTRHNPASELRKVHRFRSMKRMMVWFFAGWLTMIAVQATIRLLTE